MDDEVQTHPLAGKRRRESPTGLAPRRRERNHGPVDQPRVPDLQQGLLEFPKPKISSPGTCLTHPQAVHTLLSGSQQHPTIRMYLLRGQVCEGFSP